MNVDEAMEAAAEFRADMEARPAWPLFSETVIVVLAAEVERLRAELAAAKADIAMVEATVAENELLRVTNERLAADLAAAKADKTPPAT